MTLPSTWLWTVPSLYARFGLHRINGHLSPNEREFIKPFSRYMQVGRPASRAKLHVIFLPKSPPAPRPPSTPRRMIRWVTCLSLLLYSCMLGMALLQWAMIDHDLYEVYIHSVDVARVVTWLCISAMRMTVVFHICYKVLLNSNFNLHLQNMTTYVVANVR